MFSFRHQSLAMNVKVSISEDADGRGGDLGELVALRSDLGLDCLFRGLPCQHDNRVAMSQYPFSSLFW
jgi:hypothetical protein